MPFIWNHVEKITLKTVYCASIMTATIYYIDENVYLENFILLF